MRCRLSLALAPVVLAASCGVAHGARGDDDLARRATWAPPAPKAVKAQLDAWLRTQRLDEPRRLAIQAAWPAEADSTQPDGLLERLTDAIAAADNSAKPLVELCAKDLPPTGAPVFDLLNDRDAPGLVRNNLRLLFGRWLVQHQLYDEALEQLAALTPQDVVDPASLLFHQAVAHHRLLDKEKCLPAIAKLLENQDRIPQRYAVIARLMQADIDPLETDSLDEVARLMDDIRRRLHLHRAGTQVRKQEDDVIAKLDKMIEQMEKQRKEQQRKSQAAGNLAPNRPMEDSMPGGGKGPGDVDPKKLGAKSDWGNLPPKQREQAMQQIGKDLPAHYREVIEEYFRKIARDSGN